MAITSKNYLKDMGVKETFTFNHLVRKRGWTRGLIQKWLVPVPKTEPNYYTASTNPKTLLYYKDDVYNVESNKEFQKEFKAPRKTPPSNRYKSIEDFADIFNNMGVVYVDTAILKEMTELYIDAYISSNPRTLNNAMLDKHFTERCSYMVIRDILSTYTKDVEFLKKHKASMSVLKTYNDKLKSLILQIYPNLKGVV